MKREMLIIANPGEVGSENYCDGVNRDIDRYKDFFTSVSGGAWELREIKILVRPSSQQVDAALMELAIADYSMVVFCGHGYSRKNGTTMVELRTDVDYDSTKFNRGARKHTVILDCCRVVYEPIFESAQKRYDLKASIDSLSRSQARARFDRAVQDCPAGLAILYACGIGESAEDDEVKGGIYSSALRSAAISWSTARSSVGTASIVQMHNTATEAVSQETDGRQNPKIMKPRSAPYFPFCVAKNI